MLPSKQEHGFQKICVCAIYCEIEFKIMASSAPQRRSRGLQSTTRGLQDASKRFQAPLSGKVLMILARFGEDSGPLWDPKTSQCVLRSSRSSIRATKRAPRGLQEIARRLQRGSRSLHLNSRENDCLPGIQNIDFQVPRDTLGAVLGGTLLGFSKLLGCLKAVLRRCLLIPDP